MKNAMQKDFWREIQHTRSRFFSIMILVALSVAFLSGLKATAPDMKKTGDDYLDSLHLADIQGRRGRVRHRRVCLVRFARRGGQGPLPHGPRHQ